MRLTLSLRLLIILCGTAALSTGLALFYQERTLSRDLHGAASERLARAASAAEQLVESHVTALRERYRAVSGTPQFRATLEVGDLPTLRFYADELARREGAAAVAFLGSDGHLQATAGNAQLTAEAVGSGLPEDDLHEFGGRLYASAIVELRTADSLLGHLVGFEEIAEGRLDEWSRLCGASVYVAGPQARPEPVEQIVAQIGEVELRVGSDFASELAALSNARAQLLVGGCLALGVAFLASLFLARSVVRPILRLKESALRIREGDFAAETRIRRADELGDVGRAFDLMLAWLRGYREQVEEQHAVLEEQVDALQRGQRELARAHRMAHIGSWYLDIETGEFWGSEEFRSIFGFASGDKPIPVRDVLDTVHPEDRELVGDVLNGGPDQPGSMRIDYRIRPSRAGERILHGQSRIATDDAGRRIRIEGTVQDVTERKRSEEQIQYLAYHDSLTGLGNRLLCRERLDLEIAQARRTDELLGVLFLDLDHFKLINDSFGHSIGDELLVEVANRLVASVRESDLVARPDIGNAVSRLGGDEFTVVLAGVGDAQDLAKVARRILDRLATPFELDGHEVVVGASIGITAWPMDGEDVETLLRNADAAMYHAKEQGRNNYQFYAQSMNEVSLQRLILENKLRQALEREEFALHYQPKLGLQGGQILGYEALLRWSDPDSGPVPPGVFIPIAEETGLIIPLGEWTLREACRQLARWRDEERDLLPISVNLSIHQFRTGNLSQRIVAIVREYAIEPRHVELEITESTLMKDERMVVGELEVLRGHGFHVSIDDFGTGFSSLAHLRQLPVDALKIDRSFIVEIERNATDAALAQSIISMARALGLRVIAEGVETQGQQDLLTTWLCDEMQGFLFSRPLPPEELDRSGRSPGARVADDPVSSPR